MQLTVIIVNYNVKYFLEQCLHAVHKACAGLNAEVIVVDNNSTDGSQSYLQHQFPWVKFYWQQSNVGFGKANNRAIEHARGQKVLFLNPDTIVPEDCFVKCLKFFADHPDCGALGVRMIDGSGAYLQESKRGFPSPATSFFKMAGLAALFPKSKLFASYYAGHLSPQQNHAVQVLAGAFMMLSKKAVGVTGGFDEDFFMYGEDVDLSYRIKKAGMQNYFFADATILHFKGESTQKLSPAYTKHFYGAMLLFVQKHYSAQKATLFLMKQAIAMSKLLASFKKPQLQQAARPLNTAVVGSHTRFNQCISLLQHANPAVTIVGRIAINHDGEAAIGTLHTVKEAIRTHQIEQLLFCEGELSFKEILQQVEFLKGLTHFLFHAEGSRSVVGSSNKNSRGVFIAKP